MLFLFFQMTGLNLSKNEDKDEEEEKYAFKATKNEPHCFKVLLGRLMSCLLHHHGVNLLLAKCDFVSTIPIHYLVLKHLAHFKVNVSIYLIVLTIIMTKR